MTKIYPEYNGTVNFNAGGSGRQNEKLIPIMKQNGWRGGMASGIGSKRVSIYVPYKDIDKAIGYGFTLDRSSQKRNKEEFNRFEVCDPVDISLEETVKYSQGLTFEDFANDLGVKTDEIWFSCNDDYYCGKYAKIVRGDDRVYGNNPKAAQHLCIWFHYREIVLSYWNE